MATSDAPLSIYTVTLVAKNRAKLARFYQSIIGLNLIANDGELMTLGQGETPLLYIREDKHAQTLPQEAGLFHTAFLLPDRLDLGNWLGYASEIGVSIDGAADHFVSEAVYLTDPEGNGVEIYVDRDRRYWDVVGDEVRIGTEALDLNALMESAKDLDSWILLPSGSVIGHVHLQVGDIAKSDSFYRDTLGFTRTAQMASASFYGSGGYHHHIAGNIWNSRGAGMRSEHTTGLFELALKSTRIERIPMELVDPWGTRLRLSN
jgi:catechol 2,3-dioxygenase